ncbi:MAG: Nif3-like dinuclear metal center hexameric protein [Spirochaetaceae bacterium]|jgi:dinuclear metal center YbgI/SA1388 family protein|nr:Nif3-like dinuclear metal center hexameric protein [Spirochaetaceae bacterium]
MTTRMLDAWFRELLDLNLFSSADPSLNGLQVDNDGGEVTKIAFAVDACLETFKRAAEIGAGLLFVHHGLFWGAPLRLQGGHRQRLQFLLDANIALYAVHLPLDQHPQVGNNAALAELLGIEEPRPFGLYHGHKIGYKGTLGIPLTIEEAVQRICFRGRPPLGVYPFGPGKNRTAAVVSGGAAEESLDAIAEGIDLYVTGEASHSFYHAALEGRLNMIAGGHYSTEVWGVRRVMERCGAELSLETEFIDLPTGL